MHVGTVCAGRRGNCGQPLEKGAATLTDISGVYSLLEDGQDVWDWIHLVFVPCKASGSFAGGGVGPTRALVDLGLLEEDVSSGAHRIFPGASDWPLQAGSWAGTRPEAKRRTKVKVWGGAMLLHMPVAFPAQAGGSGASGPAGATELAGLVALTHDQRTELVTRAITAVTEALSGASAVEQR
ncbi:hypothetical protein CYMTET_38711 [Cymbomonas tetramitiformis]|uniref:Uncharacterized protein n=1 Tax=Cymbomonas tetramitiformis TaxID=36881 RepID=A0AAE0CCW8_9CHLO|nr:hypothetical protein CYMTET_38716 [Cymbomonas tetramitiformis]KAK3251970.1 hypothetical protein CYMTET_38712 [Cymbomonas tetramitiformis]KAK3251974.1 hypothetical protein CYMTET_38711 [Cymbomonas tetramitiformis]